MNEATALIEKIKTELITAFSPIPEFGTLGITVTLCQGEPVRVESSRSITRKLESKGGAE
ncbi:MAG: hypothetical protein PQJ59_12825 [Spirochaetales bacterium]|nr:hypothetical protein [Spirochaetales bacterium]